MRLQTMTALTRYCSAIAACLFILAPTILAQGGNPTTPDPEVRLAWNRFYDNAEMLTAMRRLEGAFGKWLTIKKIGESHEGRNMWLIILNDPEGLPHSEKPAMYIDANVHGNEVQGTEVCLYTIWWLLENKDRVPRVRKLLRRVAFYIVPTVNPDGREHWLHAPNTSSSSRTGKAPIDNDRDGEADEDGPDDLDGDGSITGMRKRVGPGEVGTHRLHPEDPRITIRVKPGERGDYIMLGSEGIDNDGDGRFNEDGPGGYDMNRAWPSDWQPSWIQRGAGPYPLYWPETRCVADFVLAHPNIAAMQSYHNSGGMILRGPGSKSFGNYSREDLRIYDEMGKQGEDMIPNYRYLVIWKDLYSVYGGFVNWGYEGLGIFAFTNELWATAQYGRRTDRNDPTLALAWQDRVELGANYADWKAYKHPHYGDIEIGGWKKTSRRVPPLFMLEELCHRNMAFSLYHAECMPDLALEPAQVTDLGKGLWRIRAVVENRQLIPTISERARTKKIGLPDFFTCDLKDGKVLSGGLRSGPYGGKTVDLQRHRPHRLRLEGGVPSKGRIEVEWLVTTGSSAPPEFTLTYRSTKGGVHRR